MTLWFENWTKLWMKIESLHLDWVNLRYRKTCTIKLKSWESCLPCRIWLMSREKTLFWCSKWSKLDQNKRKFEKKFCRNIMAEDILIQKVTRISSQLRMEINCIHEYWLIETFISELECFNLRTINGERKGSHLKDLSSRCEMAKNFKKLDIESLLQIWCFMPRTF